MKIYRVLVLIFSIAMLKIAVLMLKFDRLRPYKNIDFIVFSWHDLLFAIHLMRGVPPPLFLYPINVFTTSINKYLVP